MLEDSSIGSPGLLHDPKGRPAPKRLKESPLEHCRRAIFQFGAVQKVPTKSAISRSGDVHRITRDSKSLYRLKIALRGRYGYTADRCTKKTEVPHGFSCGTGSKVEAWEGILAISRLTMICERRCDQKQTFTAVILSFCLSLSLLPPLLPSQVKHMLFFCMCVLDFAEKFYQNNYPGTLPFFQNISPPSRRNLVVETYHVEKKEWGKNVPGPAPRAFLFVSPT